MTDTITPLKPLNEYPLTAHLPTELATLYANLRNAASLDIEANPSYSSIRTPHLILIKRAAVYGAKIDNALALWLVFLSGGNPGRLVMLLHSLITNTRATQDTLTMQHYTAVYGRKIPAEQSYADMWDEQKLGGANLLDIRFWERKQ